MSNDYIVVMGLGKTGLACVRFLASRGIAVRVMDNRDSPPNLTVLQQTFPEVPCLTGRFDAQQLAEAQTIVISPGLSIDEPVLAQAKTRGVPIISEIELFARQVNAPVVAITGSNGKSTVTTLVGEMAKTAGWRAQVGGNLGTPALDLLCTPAPHLYVLELSSFQLETTTSLNPKASVVLNISEDHMDRYTSINEYKKAKQHVFQGDGSMVINLDDPQVAAMQQLERHSLTFSLTADKGDFRIVPHQGESYFAQVKKGQITLLMPTTEAFLQSAIMRANILASLALGEAVGLPMSAMLDAIRSFRGLAHRCVWVRNTKGVDWYNDSKGTNVGATVAAIQGLEKPKHVILIAGGDGKGADFQPLAPVAAQHLKACVLIGRDAPLIEKALNGHTSLCHATSLEEAVQRCAELASAGDAVLLSPACASFDMFKGYDHRGRVFEQAVMQL